MKTARDPRHLRRVKVIRELFSWAFNAKTRLSPLSRQIVSHLSQIDKKIALAAADRPISQINKIDLAILRLATFELIIKKGVPFKVVVDEAVELGKEFGSDGTPALINGALGKLIKEEKIT